MKQIILEDGSVLNVKFSEWLNVMKNTDDVKSMYTSYMKEEKEIYHKINKNSVIFGIFKSHMYKFAFKETQLIDSFKKAEELINQHIDFKRIFNKCYEKEFTDDFYPSDSLIILKNNKLMFNSTKKLIFNKGQKYRYDGYNSSVTIIQMFKIINQIKYYQNAIETLCEILNIQIIGKEMLIKINERNKITFNISALKMVNNYKFLNHYIGNNIFVLESIQILALENSLKNKEINTSGELVLLITSSYVRRYLLDLVEAAKYENISQLDNNIKVLSEGYIRRLIIAYQTLGLIKLVENPPKELMRRQDKGNNYSKDYKYYVVEKLTPKILIEADKIAEKLLHNGIRPYNISKDKIDKALYNKVNKNDNVFSLKDIEIDFSLK